MLSLATRAAVILAAAVPALCHNYIVCTNAVDVPLEELLSEKDRPEIQNIAGTCKGYPRAWPGDDTPAGANRNEQAWPWQNIWPLTDGAALRNHRVCNWAQENPTYAPGYDVATVKPGSTLMMLTQTNNHVHEYADRPSGHYKIFLAGPSGTQLTTANQLTFDRVIFSAPSNKYAHIIGQPNFAGYSNDPGYAYLPVKMVDPKGNYLPPGTYNFVFAFFWSTDKPSLIDYMIPDYSTSFDVVIDPASNDEGALTKCVNTNPDCANYLVGKTSSPGAKDTTSPWPPYSGNYLFTNFDGDDPATPNGKRTFQPYWQKFVPASKMDPISTKAPVDIKERNEQELLAPIPVAGGAMMPEDVKQYPSMPAGAGESIPVVQKLAPMGVDGATDGGQTEKPAAEKPVTEKPVTEKPVTEKPVTEKPATEEAGAEKPVQTKSKKLRNRRKHRKQRTQQGQAN